MASKRASNSTGVRPAFASRRPAEPDDDEPQLPKSDPVGLAGEPGGCSWCSGRWTTASRFVHDAACPAAGRAVTTDRERRLNGL